MLEVKEISDLLNRSGAVVVMPTDTIYGLVARAKDPVAVSRMYKLKNRHSKPGTLLGLNIDDLTKLGITRKYLKAVEQFWPGAISVVIPISSPSLNYLTQGLNDIAVRIPDDLFMSKILAYCGPLMTSSANLPDQPPANNIDQAKKYFANKVDAYFDGGNLENRQPSTIIRMIDDSVEILRPGSVKLPEYE